MRTSFQPLVLAVAVIASQAQTFTQLVDFNNANGAYPCCAPLVQGTDGNLYGTTDSGGTTGSTGTFFKVSPAGTLTTLYNFSGLHGQNPSSGVILGTDGNFYGTTEFGGSNNYGTVFKITSDGVLTTLWNFTSSSQQSYCSARSSDERRLLWHNHGWRRRVWIDFQDHARRCINLRAYLRWRGWAHRWRGFDSSG
jgi:uncharacterized repeat protein (TIGR03803 family)